VAEPSASLTVDPRRGSDQPDAVDPSDPNPRRARVDLVHHLARYGAAGTSVACIYIGLTLGLSGPLSVPIQVAIPVSYVAAVVTHFLLQRHFVFRRGGFALSVRSQAGRYVVIGLSQYVVTAGATALLPGPLGVSEQVVYVAVTIVNSLVGFLLLRTRVFHA
jgi:putative flippase GtrA